VADRHLKAAIDLVVAHENSNDSVVRSFFDEATNAATHVALDLKTRCAAVIDSVLDFDAASGRTSTSSADAVINYLEQEDLTVEWLLETHVHADHLSAAPYIRRRLGGQLAMGREIVAVQKAFGKIFNTGPELAHNGSEFDRLFDDGDRFAVGSIPAIALHVPGHTPADMAYVIGPIVFVGDTLFMPDYGTARADFPGGDARQFYRSIRRLLSLPDSTNLYLCHDYKTSGRDRHMWQTTVADERAENVHVHDGVSEDAFVAMRNQRDASLPIPKLLIPSVQVNMRAGNLPEPEQNGQRYLKLPLNAF
jgi:glyoxylase-like metal-dependent hydrolase (beta-lactamase superfamily II)